MSFILAASPTVCQIFGNGSYTAGCTGRLPASGSAFSYIDLVLAMAPAVFLAGMLIMTKYYEFPYGRFLWRYNGIVGFGVSKALSAAVIGKVYKFTEKYLIFVPMGTKKAAGLLISAMPESVHQIEQKAGGLSFALVDLDVRTTVAPDVAEWADTVLTDLTDEKDWPSFLFKWKYAQLVDASKNVARYFPKVEDWNPGLQMIWLPSVVPSPSNPNPKDSVWVQKQAKDASAEQQVWYRQTSESEEKKAASVEGDLATERSLLTAAMTNAKTYVNREGKEVRLEQRDKFAYARKLNEEFANTKGTVKDALIGGKTVTAQRVAEVMRGVPNPEYVDALRENIHEQEARKKKANTGEMMTMVMIVVVLVVVLVVAVVAINKFA